MEANIDDQKLVELVQGSPELLKSIFQVACDDWVIQLQALESAIEKKDFTEIRAKIHRLNGGIRNFYAVSLVGELSQWEKAAAAEESRDWQGFLCRIRGQIDVLRENVTHLIQRLESQ